MLVRMEDGGPAAEVSVLEWRFWEVMLCGLSDRRADYEGVPAALAALAGAAVEAEAGGRLVVQPSLARVLVEHLACNVEIGAPMLARSSSFALHWDLARGTGKPVDPQELVGNSSLIYIGPNWEEEEGGAVLAGARRAVELGRAERQPTRVVLMCHDPSAAVPGLR
jgi:hypothetical protein